MIGGDLFQRFFLRFLIGLVIAFLLFLPLVHLFEKRVVFSEWREDLRQEAHWLRRWLVSGRRGQRPRDPCGRSAPRVPALLPGRRTPGARAGRGGSGPQPGAGHRRGARRRGIDRKPSRTGNARHAHAPHGQRPTGTGPADAAAAGQPLTSATKGAKIRLCRRTSAGTYVHVDVQARTRTISSSPARLSFTRPSTCSSRTTISSALSATAPGATASSTASSGGGG